MVPPLPTTSLSAVGWSYRCNRGWGWANREIVSFRSCVCALCCQVGIRRNHHPRPFLFSPFLFCSFSPFPCSLFSFYIFLGYFYLLSFSHFSLVTPFTPLFPNFSLFLPLSFPAFTCLCIWLTVCVAMNFYYSICLYREFVQSFIKLFILPLS